jgi:hypothetical protein
MSKHNTELERWYSFFVPKRVGKSISIQENYFSSKCFEGYYLSHHFHSISVLATKVTSKLFYRSIKVTLRQNIHGSWRLICASCDVYRSSLNFITINSAADWIIMLRAMIVSAACESAPVLLSFLSAHSRHFSEMTSPKKCAESKH